MAGNSLSFGLADKFTTSGVLNLNIHIRAFRAGNCLKKEAPGLFGNYNYELIVGIMGDGLLRKTKKLGKKSWPFAETSNFQHCQVRAYTPKASPACMHLPMMKLYFDLEKRIEFKNLQAKTIFEFSNREKC